MKKIDKLRTQRIKIINERDMLAKQNFERDLEYKKIQKEIEVLIKENGKIT